jgi:hypothetical protein
MPEICGTAADYFDPENHESVREAIERLVSDPSRRKQRIIEGHRQAEKDFGENVQNRRPRFIAPSVIVIWGE